MNFVKYSTVIFFQKLKKIETFIDSFEARKRMNLKKEDNIIQNGVHKEKIKVEHTTKKFFSHPMRGG